VDWKATAHTGALQIREFAREEEPLVEVLLDIEVPDEHRAWFEYAIECCAYLVWHLSQREARVRFASQEMTTTVPATGDVYRILKYLALVSPRFGSPPPGPAEEGSFYIVFSANAGKYEQTGWSRAHFVGPESASGGSR